VSKSDAALTGNENMSIFLKQSSLIEFTAVEWTENKDMPLQLVNNNKKRSNEPI